MAITFDDLKSNMTIKINGDYPHDAVIGNITSSGLNFAAYYDKGWFPNHLVNKYLATGFWEI